MNSNQTQLARWASGTVTIAKVRSHTDMYVVEHGDGFHNITASYDYMIANYPPNRYARNGRILTPIKS